MMEDILEVELEKLVYGGEAMGRLPDGRAVFVPFSLPGEKVRIRLVEEKRGFARAELIEVISASDERIAPRCKHFSVCGGCHYQHIPYDVQLKVKADVMREQLERIGKIENPPVREMIASSSEWDYRNFIQLHQDEEGRLGYQAAGSHTVVPIEECFLPHPALGALWPRLKLDPLPGLERLGLRVGIDDEVMIIFESGEDEAYDFEVDFPVTAVQLGPESTHILSDNFYLPMKVKDQVFRVSAESFFQVNNAVGEDMIDHLLDILPLTKETTLLDVYCGVGLFSAFLAPKVGRLIGVEASPSAVADFEVNLDAFKNVDIYESPAEAVLPGLKEDVDVVVLDPPRAGLAPAVRDAVIEIGAGVVAYVSCDPATLARDAKRLIEGGYELKQVTPFDLFPQTYHIESISLFEKK